MDLANKMKAPDFKMPTDDGQEITLADFAGKWLVLYFYPKDSTPGCTQEACDFRDNMEAITAKGVSVVGVSPNSEKSHQNFKTKHELNFTLAVDADKSVAASYTAYGEKKMYGKIFFGIIRSTFIINPDGEIVYAFPKVKVKGHVAEVMAKLDELGA